MLYLDHVRHGQNDCSWASRQEAKLMDCSRKASRALVSLSPCVPRLSKCSFSRRSQLTVALETARSVPSRTQENRSPCRVSTRGTRSMGTATMVAERSSPSFPSASLPHTCPSSPAAISPLIAAFALNGSDNLAAIEAFIYWTVQTGARTPPLSRRSGVCLYQSRW